MLGVVTELLVTLGGAGVGVVVTLFVAIALHELGHTLVARLVGFRVLQIAIGGGAPIIAFWCGPVLVTLGKRFHHGWVAVSYRPSSWFRTRAIAVFLAGPLVFVALAVLLGMLHYSGEVGWPWRGVCLGSFYAAAFLAIGGVLSDRLWSASQSRGDVSHAIAMLRTDASDVAEVVELSRLSLLETELDRLTLTGRLEPAKEMVDQLIASEQLPFPWWHKRSLISLALGDEGQAMSDLKCAETGLNEWWEDQSTDGDAAGPALANSQQLQALYLRINRAFFLVLTGDASNVSEAEELLATSKVPRNSSESVRCALQRTRALVLLFQGFPRKAQRMLLDVRSCQEPYWLRALTLGYLSHAHRLLGDGRQARRWRRKATFLHPQSSLLYVVDRALTAREPAPTGVAS